MHLLVRTALSLWALTAVIASASSAHAASILNLSGQPQTVELRTAQGYVPTQIAPNGRWYVAGNAYIRFRDRETYIEDNEEYAIWKDAFGPQRRYQNHRFGH